MIRYRNKPQPVRPRDDDVWGAVYEPGQPLDDLAEVAHKADKGWSAEGDAELAEVRLPSGPVVLVRWRRISGDGPSETEWTVVQPGQHLMWHEDEDTLFAHSQRDLDQWYERAGP